MSKISLTIDTEDNKVVREVAEMLLRLGGSAQLPQGASPSSLSVPEVAVSLSVPEVAVSLSVPEVAVYDCSYFTEPSNDGELDSEGIPWDARIHTTARTKVANGTWKLARNTPPELVASVKAEYLGNGMSPMQSNVNIAEQQDAPITKAPPPPPPPLGSVTGDPLRQLMSDIAKGGFMPSEINAALQKHGVPTLQVLRNHPDKFEVIRMELGL